MMNSFSLPSIANIEPVGTGKEETIGAHVYVRGVPSILNETNLHSLFAKFGEVLGCKLILNGSGPTANAVVVLATGTQAMDAVRALNGVATNTGVLEVILLPGLDDSQLDVTQEPSDNLYLRQLPSTWSEKELKALFSLYGTVQECRVLHRGSETRGVRALVRMQSVAEATYAILAINGQVPRSMSGEFITQPLLVRFADSPEEKARKQAQKELQAAIQHKLGSPMLTNLPRKWSLPAKVQPSAQPIDALRQASLPLKFGPHPMNDLLGVGVPPVPASHAFTTGMPPIPASHAFTTSGMPSIPASHAFAAGMPPVPSSNAFTAGALKPDYLSQLNVDALLSRLASVLPANNQVLLPNGSAGLAMNGFHPGLSGSPKGPLPAAPLPQAPHMSMHTGIYVRNVPADATDLWVFEKFAPHGPILNVKVLHEEGTTRCCGVCFVNYTTVEGAMNAIRAMNGRKFGDKPLHVALSAHK